MEEERSFRLTTALTKPYGLGRVVGRAQLERHLVFLAQVNALRVPPPAQIPEVEPVAVLPLEQQVTPDTVLHHPWCAPLAGDHGVVPQVPPEVVVQVLVAPVDLPAAEHMEAVVVEDEDAAGPVAVGRAQRADVDAVRTAVYRVAPGVASAGPPPLLARSL